MNTAYQKFLQERIQEIQDEIDQLPPDFRGERNADSLGIDLEFYKAGYEVFLEYLAETHQVA